MADDLEDLFTNRPPTPDQATFLDYITATMIETAGVLYQLPPSRYRSLALTKLEEVSMWAKKATVFTYHVEPGPEDVDPLSQNVLEAADHWAAYQAAKRAGEPHETAIEGAETGVTLPGKVFPDLADPKP